MWKAAVLLYLFSTTNLLAEDHYFTLIKGNHSICPGFAMSKAEISDDTEYQSLVLYNTDDRLTSYEQHLRSPVDGYSQYVDRGLNHVTWVTKTEDKTIFRKEVTKSNRRGRKVKQLSIRADLTPNNSHALNVMLLYAGRRKVCCSYFKRTIYGDSQESQEDSQEI